MPPKTGTLVRGKRTGILYRRNSPECETLWTSVAEGGSSPSIDEFPPAGVEGSLSTTPPAVPRGRGERWFPTFIECSLPKGDRD
ncbi:hypothetical protein KKB40_03095 [Patescibacteria group bacterium]|nr:hypothetical protein [Patescibacteria group bacterium]